MAGGLCYYCSTQRTHILLETNQAHSQATLSDNDHSAVCSQAHERHSDTATRAKCGGCGRVREYVQPFASTHHITHLTPSSRAITEPRFVHRYHDARYTTTRTHTRGSHCATHLDEGDESERGGRTTSETNEKHAPYRSTSSRSALFSVPQRPDRTSQQHQHHLLPIAIVSLARSRLLSPPQWVPSLDVPRTRTRWRSITTRTARRPR